MAPLLAILGPGPSAYDLLGAVPGCDGNRSPNDGPRIAYDARDGRWVAISASAASVAERAMTVVGRPDIAAQDWFPSARGRVRRADDLDRIVGDWFAASEFEEVMSAFQQAGAAIVPFYDAEQVVNDPHVQATGMIASVDDEDLRLLKMQEPPVPAARGPGRIRFPGRRLGQDTGDVYRTATASAWTRHRRAGARGRRHRTVMDALRAEARQPPERRSATVAATGGRATMR